MMMEFKLGRRRRSWTTLPSKEDKNCDVQMLKGFCRGGAQCFAVVGDEDQ